VLRNTLNKHEDAEHFHFFDANHGQAALDILACNCIDLIFLDWNMPVMNGEEFVDTLRQNRAYDKIRIIMATTKGGKEAVTKMAKKGVNAYLVKTFKQDQILKSFNTVYARMR
jgi:two-component system chemotaxis response regulator CheY